MLKIYVHAYVKLKYQFEDRGRHRIPNTKPIYIYEVSYITCRKMNGNMCTLGQHLKQIKPKICHDYENR